MDKLTFMYRSVVTHAYQESDLDSAGGALDLSPCSSQPCMTAAERVREMGGGGSKSFFLEGENPANSSVPK